MHRIRTIGTATGALLAVAGLIFPTGPAYAAFRSPTVYAHRAGAAYAPENTLAAIRNAHRLGISWVENDVQRTKDGRLVVIHDATLSRTTNVEKLYPKRSPWRVKDFTLKEIKRLDAGGWFSRKYAGERIPTLKQYLEQLDRTGQGVLLELKQPQLYPGVESQTLTLLRKEGWLDKAHVTHRLVIQSFSVAALRTTHRLRPSVHTGFLGNPDTADLRSYAAFADQINPDEKTVTLSYVDAVHRHRGPHGVPMQVNAWTVDHAREAATLTAMGVDGIITNKPDVIENAVGQAANWPGPPRSSGMHEGPWSVVDPGPSEERTL
ncbi:glycerophosphodiester phosphodiesterase [Actinacidiphila soli]|uniref:glycerophosphodiester phosphodiesterase n=1 Tax=Actinacidiphila soli TaxID=2487275 RepID=UPI000FCA5771|nr:glycerophosphodiester phosphodiesterase family protein [Actinacidiphila soli]